MLELLAACLIVKEHHQLCRWVKKALTMPRKNIRTKRCSVKDFEKKRNAASGGTKSAGNGGAPKGRLQVLHVNIFFVAPLSSGHMA